MCSRSSACGTIDHMIPHACHIPVLLALAKASRHLYSGRMWKAWCRLDVPQACIGRQQQRLKMLTDVRRNLAPLCTLQCLGEAPLAARQEAIGCGGGGMYSKGQFGRPGSCQGCLPYANSCCTDFVDCRVLGLLSRWRLPAPCIARHLRLAPRLGGPLKPNSLPQKSYINVVQVASRLYKLDEVSPMVETSMSSSHSSPAHEESTRPHESNAHADHESRRS